jgi:hypothetical protein
MKNVNLQEFYSVSGANQTRIFLTEEEAGDYCQTHNELLSNQLERWLAGDYSVSSSMVQTRLESDLDGGSYMTYHVRPDLWAGYKTHEAFTTTESVWSDADGFSRVNWGNAATARPSKKSARFAA